MGRFLLNIGWFLLWSMQLSVAQWSSESPMLAEHMRYSVEKKFNTWSVYAGYGSMIVYTDVTDYSILPSSSWQFAPTFVLSKQLLPAFSVDAQLVYGEMEGAKGAFYFDGDVFDYSVSFTGYINQMLVMPGPHKDHWNYYLKVGLGVFAFRSRLYSSQTGEVVSYGSVNNNSDERYYVSGYDLRNPQEKTARVKELMMPLGAGVQYRLNRSFDLVLESTLRVSLEDNLENILLGSQNDRFWFTSIGLSYKIGRKNKRHSRWTYRGYGINIFGSPKEDPLRNEIVMLEEQISAYAASRPLKKDSVIIVSTLKRIYGNDKVKSVFFDKNRMDIKTEDKIILAEIAIELRKNSDWQLFLLGYSDASGDESTNMAFSIKRCEAVQDLLVNDFGISLERISLEGRGEMDLLSPTEELSPRGIDMVNRRVDVVFVPQGGKLPSGFSGYPVKNDSTVQKKLRIKVRRIYK